MTAMQLVWAVIKTLIMVMFVLNLAAILTWADRRQSSMIQDRIGPNRAVLKIFGKEFRVAGLLHTAADGVKFFFKEDFMPPKADRLLPPPRFPSRLLPLSQPGAQSLPMRMSFPSLTCSSKRTRSRTSSPKGSSLPS